MDPAMAQQLADALTQVAEALQRVAASLAAPHEAAQQKGDEADVPCEPNGHRSATQPANIARPPISGAVGERVLEHAQPIVADAAGLSAASSGSTQATDDAPVEEPRPSTADVLREHAARHGVAVRGYHLPTVADEPLDQLATELSDGLERLGDLPRVLRRGASTQRPQVVRLRDESAGVVSTTVAMAQRLHELGLLSHARHDRGARTLTVRVTEVGVAFLAGGWLARRAATALAAAFPHQHHEPAVLRAVELQLTDASTALVDAIALTLDGRLVCLHTYAGTYQDQLGRCVRLRRALRLDADQHVVVLATASQAACRELGAIHGLTVTAATDVESTVAAALSSPHNPALEPSLTAPAPDGAPRCAPAHPADVERMRILLRDCQIHPRAEHRRAILAATAATLDGSPRDVRELKAAVAETAGASRAAVRDVFVALARGGGLLGTDGTGLASLGLPAAAVSSPSVEVLEQCCLTAYRAAVRAQDPTALGCAAAESALRTAVA